MKVVKPTKLPVLHRVVEVARRPRFHVGALLAFPLEKPRELLDELSFWKVTSTALGEYGVIDEGISKARGELLLGGSFFAPGGKPVTASFVRVTLGAIDKRLAVVGDRFWQNDVPTPPVPFTTLPITWSHAFGGPGFDKNPYGKGVTHVPIAGKPALPLPNIERYGQLIRSPGERPEPAGLSPMDGMFAQRKARGGTYDKRYLEEWFPGLPGDADPLFFNVAPEDQWLPREALSGVAGGPFFSGDEQYTIENMHPDEPRITGRLPGLSARLFVTRRMGQEERFQEIPLRCDTVWLLPSAGIGVVVFHGAIPIVSDDAAEIKHLVAACEDPASPKPISHYEKALTRRLDKDTGALSDLSDSDLMPSRESGVSANLRLSDLDEGRWTKGENLAMKRARKGQERQFEQARAKLIERGLDPSEYGLSVLPPPPDEPPLDDLDALAAYMLAQETKGEEQRKLAEKKAEEAKAQARKAFAEMGRDYDAEMAKAEREGGGPPKLTAVGHLTQLSAQVAEAAAQGIPMDELESQLKDSSYWEQLKAQEEGVRDMYRRFAHLQPAASPIEEEAAERLRVLILLAKENDESLARRDFTGAKLSGQDLRGIDLTGSFLEGADLSNVNLAGASLENAVLTRADLRGAVLSGAQLTGANLGGADLTGAMLEDAQMSECVLSRARIDRACFRRAQLRGADFHEAQRGAPDLSSALLTEVIFLRMDLTGALFVGADLTSATFVECQLDEANFSAARLEKATFVTCRGAGVSFRGAEMKQSVFVHGSVFPDADLSGANLENANLRGTLLPGARLDGATLSGADLSECDASHGSFTAIRARGSMWIRTKLTKASLRGADLMDALLSKTDLAGADFTGANLYRADLSRALRDATTTFAEAKIERIRTLPKADLSGEGS